MLMVTMNTMTSTPHETTASNLPPIAKLIATVIVTPTNPTMHLFTNRLVEWESDLPLNLSTQKSQVGDLH